MIWFYFVSIGRLYAKKATGFKKKFVHRPAPVFHLADSYRPNVPTPHALIDDDIALSAHEEASMKSSSTSHIPSIEEVRRKATAQKNLEKVIAQVTSENEDPLIRQAYEELEDEDRLRRGLAPLRRAPPGKLKQSGWSR